MLRWLYRVTASIASKAISGLLIAGIGWLISSVNDLNTNTAVILSKLENLNVRIVSLEQWRNWTNEKIYESYKFGNPPKEEETRNKLQQR